MEKGSAFSSWIRTISRNSDPSTLGKHIRCASPANRKRQDDIIIRTQGLRRIVQTRKRPHSPITVFRGATDQIPSFRSGNKKELAHQNSFHVISCAVVPARRKTSWITRVTSLDRPVLTIRKTESLNEMKGLSS